MKLHRRTRPGDDETVNRRLADRGSAQRASPRRPVLGYRPANPAAERARARALANEALALNPDHPSALATIALGLTGCFVTTRR